MVNFKKQVEKRARGPLSRSRKGFVPRNIQRNYVVNIQIIDERAIATFERSDKVSDVHLVFFHGGAYIFEASSFHWKLAEEIVNRSFCRMTLIDYPLAPEHSYRETFKMVQGAYKLLTDLYPGDSMILMGDSAGGGLALALSRKLTEEPAAKLPVKNILLSPWLDMTLSNPEIKNLKRSDHILSVEMLRIAGSKYANGDDLSALELSPVNGEFKDLPATIVFFGTEEIFYADCNRLRSIAASNREPFIFREYPGMQHDWAIFPVPERKLVVAEICDFIHS